MEGPPHMNRCRAFPLEDIAVSKTPDGRTVEAFAAVFNTPAEVRDADGHYREQIHPQAFTDSIAKAKRGETWAMPVVYNHGLTLAGTPSDRATVPLGTTLHMEATSRGLLTVSRYSKTELADEVLESIRNGSITGQSFTGKFLQSDGHRRGQRLAPNRDGDLPLVTRTEVKLIEYGPTPFPVYSDAAIVGVRTVSEVVADELGEAAAQLRRMAIRWSAQRADIRKVIYMAKRSEILAGEMESIRARLLDLDAVEEPTEEQVEQARAALDEFTKLEEQHRAAVEHEAKMERVRSYALTHPESRESGFAAPMVNIKRDPFADLGSIRSMDDEDLRARAVTAISEVRYRGNPISDESRERAVRMIEDIDGVAEHALVFGSPDYMAAFRSWFRAGQRNQAPVYTEAEAAAIRASLSLTSANGGYVLPTLLDPSLIRTGTVSKNPIRRIARVETGTQDKWNGVTAGAVTTYWKAEGSAFTDGTGTFGSVQVDAAMLTAYVTASYEIFQDSNLQSQLPGLIGEAIDTAEQTAFISGSGSDAPKGIVTAISATVASTVTATTRGTFNATSAVDTLALLNSLPVRFEDSSTWVMNKATYRSIAQQVTGTAGVPLIEMTDRNNLLDLPVVRASDMPSATTSGNIMIVLGDFSRFIIYDRIGVSLEFIPNVVDGSGIPTGQRGLVAYKRVGSNTADINAFRFLKA